MNDACQSVILFYSSNHAIWAVRVLKTAGIAARLIPTPKQLSSECGHAVALAAADKDVAINALLAREVPFDRCDDLPP